MNENSDEIRRYRFRVIKIGAAIIGICYFIALWYATQNVAEACNYHPLLGKYITLGGINWYLPINYWLWCHDENIAKAIPSILNNNDKWTTLAIMAGILGTYGVTKNMKPNTTHGSASWATSEDITKSDLGEYETKNGGVFPTKKIKKAGRTIEVKQKIVKKSGIVVGVNPYTHKLMLHNGPEHMLLVAPTRSGKGVNTIIPTGLIWQDSIFFFDPKGELWANTAGYRKKYLHQTVMKFQPLCTDGSGASWNPLAEVNYRTAEEWPDITTLVNVMVKPDGEKKGGGDPFWENSAASLLNGVIVHLLYQHDKEGLPLPCPSDIMSFLSSPDPEVAFSVMQKYPHISEKEFLEEEIKDKDGNPILDNFGQPKHYKNPFKEIYGEYIKDFTPFSKALGIEVKSVEAIRLAIIEKRKMGVEIDFQENELDPDEKEMSNDAEKPWFRLLTHPKVAECASNFLTGAEQTRASILQTAQADLGIYQNPVVQKNTQVSDFAIRDLLDPSRDVALYLVMEVKDIAMVRPLARLFINTLLNKLIRDMKFDNAEKKPEKAPQKPQEAPAPKVSLEKEQPKTPHVNLEKAPAVPPPPKPKPKYHRKPKDKQRLLLMLDEFPQLGNMESIELALAICAGYGIKICIVVQSLGQLNKIYTKENAIPSNCHVQVYFTPTLEDGGGTAKTLSETLGKKTIDTVSHSDGGGLGKGSNSTSSTGRELMTPDEISHMSSEKELVFVAGHKPIFGDKLRYYLNKMLLRRKKCGCPPISDKATQVWDYKQLFAVHEADKEEERKKEETVLRAKLARDHKTIEQYFAEKKQKEEEYEEEIAKKLHQDDQESQKDNGASNPEGREATYAERARRPSSRQMMNGDGEGSFPHRRPGFGNLSRQGMTDPAELSPEERRERHRQRIEAMSAMRRGVPMHQQEEQPPAASEPDAASKKNDDERAKLEMQAAISAFDPKPMEKPEEATTSETTNEDSPEEEIDPNAYDGDDAPDFDEEEPVPDEEENPSKPASDVDLSTPENVLDAYMARESEQEKDAAES